MAPLHPFFLAGRWEEAEEKLEVVSPYNGEVVGITFQASGPHLETAIQAAQEAFEVTRKLPSYERARILSLIAGQMEEQRESLARSIAQESGKPLKDASLEVERAVLTFQVAAEEAKRLGGEVIPLDLMPPSRGRWGLTRRFPIGPIAAISPFNFPLNLAAHKLAPAIATGNPLILKPPSKSPLTILRVAQMAQRAGLPPGAFSVLPLSHQVGERLASDDRIKMLTFTGSSAVGWAMKEKAGKKRVVLELGGNAGVIVDKGANLKYAVPRITYGSFSLAGQSCISVQRIYIHQDIFDEFTHRFLYQVKGLKVGDPLDPETDVGPLIDPAAVARTQQWVAEAVREGAQILAGGQARGRFFEPTILTGVNPQSKVCREEVFAPIVDLFPFHDFQEAVAQVNQSAYGLQAGVFTPHLENALYGFEELVVGGVILNDIPTYRIDHMPYGGVKDSGYGREGLKYAMEEMTELKLLVINRL